MKKIIIFTITFIMILAGMTYLLKEMQPPPIPDTALADSLLADSLYADSLYKDSLRAEMAKIQMKKQIDSLTTSLARVFQENKQLSEAKTKAEEANRIEISEEFEKKTKEMAKIYENMSAQKAALILSNLDKNITVKLLTKMKKRKAAQIMAALDPRIAVSISKEMAKINR